MLVKKRMSNVSMCGCACVKKRMSKLLVFVCVCVRVKKRMSKVSMYVCVCVCEKENE